MALERNDSEELEKLRQILLGPFEEHSRLRDEKILQVMQQIQASTFERVAKLEETVKQLSDALDEDRNRTVTEIGDAMAQLGQQLRSFGIEHNPAPIAETPEEAPKSQAKDPDPEPEDKPAAQAAG